VKIAPLVSTSKAARFQFVSMLHEGNRRLVSFSFPARFPSFPFHAYMQETGNELDLLRMNRPVKDRSRPHELTEEQCDELLQRITDGDSRASIVDGDEWPSYRTIFRRIEEDEEFRRRYDRARAVQAERWADELVVLPDSLPENATAEQVAVAKLQVDTRKWIIGKRLPKKYGDWPAEVNVNTQLNLFQISIEDQKRIQEARRQLLEEDNTTK